MSKIRADKGKFIAYIRMSTNEQSKSGLSLDAQRTAIEKFIKDMEVK